jgi:hypothetical protein
MNKVVVPMRVGMEIGTVQALFSWSLLSGPPLCGSAISATSLQMRVPNDSAQGGGIGSPLGWNAPPLSRYALGETVTSQRSAIRLSLFPSRRAEHVR